MHCPLATESWKSHFPLHTQKGEDRTITHPSDHHLFPSHSSFPSTSLCLILTTSFPLFVIHLLHAPCTCRSPKSLSLVPQSFSYPNASPHPAVQFILLPKEFSHLANVLLYTVILLCSRHNNFNKNRDFHF